MSELVFCERFSQLDDELKKEFYADVQDRMNELNTCAKSLSEGDYDTEELVQAVFRAVHTIKGNCNMVLLDPYVEVTHYLEEMVQDLRGKKYDYHPAYIRLFVSAMNVVDELLIATCSTNEADSHRLLKLLNLVSAVRKSDEDLRIQTAKRAEQAIIDAHFSLDLVAMTSECQVAFSIFSATDIEYFQYLSHCFGKINPIHNERIQHIIIFASLLNEKLGMVTEMDQLSASIYCYEFFNILSYDHETDEAESVTREDIERRIFAAGGLLARMSGWQDASEIVFQCQEHYDGNGYPKQLSGDDIRDDAQILQISHQFVEACLSHRHLGYKTSLLAAVKNVNNSAGTVYKADIVNAFNDVVKTHYLSHAHW